MGLSVSDTISIDTKYCDIWGPGEPKNTVSIQSIDINTYVEYIAPYTCCEVIGQANTD